MTRDRVGVTPEATLFLVVLALAAIVLLVTSTDACHTPVVTEALTREPHAAASCLEFWLYRYQGLLGGIFTLAAAGVAWIGLQQQIRVGRVGDLRRSLANLRDVRGKLNECASSLIRLLDVERQALEAGSMTLASAQADALARLAELGRLNGVRIEVKAIRREELFDDDLEALLTAVNETMKGAGRLVRGICGGDRRGAGRRRLGYRHRQARRWQGGGLASAERHQRRPSGADAGHRCGGNGTRCRNQASVRVGQPD